MGVAIEAGAPSQQGNACGGRWPNAKALPIRAGAPAGFTLVEVLLAIAIFLILAGVVTYTMFGRVEDQYLDEGAARLETALRMARAEAARQGRRVRLVADADLGQLRVQFEPQPLAQPGEFIDLEASWTSYLPNDMVRVARCQRMTDEYETVVLADDAGQSATSSSILENFVDAVEFTPDGLSSGMVIELKSLDARDTRRAVVTIDAVTQEVSTRMLDVTELAKWYEENHIVMKGEIGGL